MRIPVGNLFLLLSAIILAVLLWFWVGAEERSEIIVGVPLEYRNLPKGYELLADRELLTKVNIWVRGSTATIKRLRPEEISVWVDLQKMKPGEKSFELTQDHVLVPFGFSVLRISPSQIKLRLEKVVNRMVPVVPRLEGEPPVGYAVTESNVTPPQVEIVGPQSAVSSVRQANTDSIDVSRFTENHVEKVNVGVDNPAVRLGTVKQVTILLHVSEIEDVLTLRNIPVAISGTTRIVRFSPRFVRVDLRAPKRILSDISENQFKAVLELEALKPGVYELTPRIVYEPDQKKKLTIEKVIPERIHTRIQ